MPEKFTMFDAADYLDDAEAIEFFMNDALETESKEYVINSLETVSRSKGMLELKAKSGMTGEALRAILAEKRLTSLENAVHLMKSIGFQLKGN